MYESEIYLKKVQEKFPEDVSNKFKETFNSIKSRSVLHWTEHCTECAMPDCFKTCSLYSPRFDGKCRRFVNGIEKITLNKNQLPYLLKISFKKWGVLATQGNHRLYSIEEAESQERIDRIVSELIHFPLFMPVKKQLAQKRYSIKKKNIISEQKESGTTPDAFLAEIYNPSSEIIYLNLTIRNEDSKYRKVPFQFRLMLQPGYNKEIIPFEEIDKRIKTNLSYRIDFTPEKSEGGVTLYFGLTEFVQLKNTSGSSKKAKKIKCIVWDLDNTMWDGTLIESGVEKLKLKNNIKEILTSLEEKGVIHSIASKNNPEEVFSALKHFGIEEYFLFPKISWIPKSAGIKEIARDLNIGVDSLLFIDDSVFEREEVKNSLPGVQVVDAAEYNSLLAMECFKGIVTEEGKNRKQLYLNEATRKEKSENFDGEYLDFLKSCDIRMELLPLVPEYYERVYELTQRTNQMNFSGNIYKAGDIEKIAGDDNLDKYVLKCSDKFGDYGIIGFALINKKENRLIDLMFSCRIQSKRVEHAFITFCLNKYLKDSDFFVTYKRTERNKFSAQVFNDFKFKIESEKGDLKNLVFYKNESIPNDKLIEVQK